MLQISPSLKTRCDVCMAAPVHPVEEAFKSRDGLSPLNCRNWEAVGRAGAVFCLGQGEGHVWTPGWLGVGRKWNLSNYKPEDYESKLVQNFMMLISFS